MSIRGVNPCPTSPAGRKCIAMGLDQPEIEGEAQVAYRAAGIDPYDTVSPIWLAKRLLGEQNVVAVYSLMQPGGGCLARVNGTPRIYYRNRLPPERRDFVVAHELGHALLRDQAGDEAETELACDAFAAAIIAPRGAYLAAVRAYGARYPKLARAFATTESLVALRFGEVTDEPLALLTPRSIRVRGSAYSWPDSDRLRQLAAMPRPGLRKTVLKDAVQRVALLGTG
jgi:IrrE N-terminal-like domain